MLEEEIEDEEDPPSNNNILGFLRNLLYYLWLVFNEQQKSTYKYLKSSYSRWSCLFDSLHNKKKSITYWFFFNKFFLLLKEKKIQNFHKLIHIGLNISQV